ncbi:MAG: YcxB family protein [Pseudomonadota bacterium]
MAEQDSDRPLEEAGYTINYEITADDLAAMMVDRERHVLPRVKAVAFFALLLVFVACFGVGLWVWSREGFGEAAFLLGLSGFFLIAIPLAKWVLPIYVARFYHRKLALHGTAIETTFMPSGMQSTGGGISSDLAWSTVIKTTRTPTHFFFWINKVQAIIIPLRTLPSEADQEGLWQLAQDCTTGQTS